MSPADLIGKKFKYNSKYGLSDWTDEISEIKNCLEIRTVYTYASSRSKFRTKTRQTIQKPFGKWIIVGRRCGQRYSYNEIIVQDGK